MDMRPSLCYAWPLCPMKYPMGNLYHPPKAKMLSDLTLDFEDITFTHSHFLLPSPQDIKILLKVNQQTSASGNDESGHLE